MTKSRKTSILGAATLAAAAVAALAGCASATTACVVRHGYAIVIFQNGVANNSKHFVTRFRLNVKYGPHDIRRRFVGSRIILRAAKGSNPPVIVKTYRV